jgi:choline dehydrogenase-like flavoprotein
VTRDGPVSRWRERARRLVRGARRRLVGLHADHHMGTCRMGRNSARNVTDADLRVHGSPNLYVAGSAIFVTGGAANPP